MLSKMRETVAAWIWSRRHDREDLVSWMHEPFARRYINASVSGSEHVWPMEWFRDELGTTLDLGLSVGCGLGALERDVVSKGICRRMVGVDISDLALEKARELAADDGLGDDIEYVKGSFNEAFWGRPERFDIIFFHQAMHHVEKLELCLEHVVSILKPGGFLFLDEYVGPSRTDWGGDRMAEATRVFQTVPPRYRRGRLRAPIDWRDPSEAIRSAEIEDNVARHFEPIQERGYGGNLLAVLHPYLQFDGVPEEERNSVLSGLVDAERRVIANGERPFYRIYWGRVR
ncbi:MAG: class I SAM-dependent methyltransferase [Acidobacteriota bacterium]